MQKKEERVSKFLVFQVFLLDNFKCINILWACVCSFIRRTKNSLKIHFSISVPLVSRMCDIDKTERERERGTTSF